MMSIRAIRVISHRVRRDANPSLGLLAPTQYWRVERVRVQKRLGLQPSLKSDYRCQKIGMVYRRGADAAWPTW